MIILRMIFFLGVLMNSTVAHSCDVTRIFEFKRDATSYIAGFGQDYSTAEVENTKLIETFRKELQTCLSIWQLPLGYRVSASPPTFIHERDYDKLIGLRVSSPYRSFFCTSTELTGEVAWASVFAGDMTYIFEDSEVWPKVFWGRDSEKVALAATNSQSGSGFLPNMLLFVKRSGSRFGIGWLEVPEDMFSKCRRLVEANGAPVEIQHCYDDVVSKNNAMFEEFSKEYWSRISLICNLNA